MNLGFLPTSRLLANMAEYLIAKFGMDAGLLHRVNNWSNSMNHATVSMGPEAIFFCNIYIRIHHEYDCWEWLCFIIGFHI